MRQQISQCEQIARLELLGYIDEAITAKLAEQCRTIQRQIEPTPYVGLTDVAIRTIHGQAQTVLF